MFQLTGGSGVGITTDDPSPQADTEVSTNEDQPGVEARAHLPNLTFEFAGY
jgi:hypothetical protein